MTPPVLTPEQRALVEGALHVVERAASRVARRYPSSLGEAELRSIGYEGLVSSARAFDPAVGVPFEAWAQFRVQGAMLDEIRKEAKERARVEGAARLQRFLAEQTDESDAWGDSDEKTAARLDAFADAALLFLAEASARAAARGAEDEIAARADHARALGALRAARGDLQPNDRRLLEVVFDEEREVRGAAEALGTSISTVRRRLNLVLGRLGARLRREGAGP